MIYIDPPYNTGKEFIYPDKFQDNLETYLRYTGQKDDEGFKISSNTESSGRYHTNWLNMMYPRLKLARNLLHQNGIIFISIDDTEQDNLKKLCNEIFGEENFLACIANVSNPKGRSDDKYIATAHEYVLVYKKLDVSLYGWEPEEKVTRRYNKEDAGGRYREIDLRKTGDNDRREDRPNLFYSFFHNEESGDFYPSREAATPEGYIEIIPTREDGSEGNWRWELNSAKEKINILIPKYMPVRSKWSVFVKDYLTPDKRVKPTSAWTQKFANSERGSEQFINLGFEKGVFPFPKPIGLIQAMLKMATTGHDVVLDFFTGSASTVHAIFTQNVEDNNDRRFIVIQLPEKTDGNSIPRKNGFQNIAEIGMERIRLAAAKIKKENPEYEGDLGFKVFKLDSSNIRAWNPDRNDLEQTLIDHMEHLVEGRSEEDVLYELLLKRGVDLTVPIEEKTITDKTVYSIGYGVLFACLDTVISREEVEGLAMGIIAWLKELEPASDTQVVFRDSAFANDIAKTNMTAILEQNGIKHVRSL